MKDNNKVLVFVLGLIVFSYFLATYIVNHYEKKPAGDIPLTDKQVLDKAQQCKGAIQLVYDDEWNVYAVKCVYGGFTGDGRRK